jgi:hypothetical protein
MPNYSAPHLRDWTETVIIVINMLMPVNSIVYTHLRALLVLHDRGVLAHATGRVTGLGMIGQKVQNSL